MIRPNATSVFVRDFHPGMGRAVAERTILRKHKDGCWESWGDVAHRVALGNSLLCNDASVGTQEYDKLLHHISKASLLMSGRHLQHGDETQPGRNKEVFTNCSTAPTSFLKFYLLMNGSGVGRSYDDDMMLVNWDNAPTLRCVLSENHPDFDWSAHESARDALHKYGGPSRNVKWFTVPDTREGWAKAVEVWETMAFEKIHSDKMLILDFSQVRAKGQPIQGMQNRPASGPVPLMNAFSKARSLKGAGLPMWKQAMFVDHYFSECVLVGGARRSASMSTKFWKDKDILDFIQIKRPIEFLHKSVDDVVAMRKEKQYDSFLWSSNNSVTVDEEFWLLLDLIRNHDQYGAEDARWARMVFKTICACSYGDGTGEPGMINVDKLVRNDEGYDKIKADYVGSKKYQIDEDTEILIAKLVRIAKKKKYNMIVNPCGEIELSVLGGYCVIADVVPFHCDTLDEVEDCLRTAVRALIRTNQMDCIYMGESKRTNRIGVGLTGVLEFAWKFFGAGFRDLIDPQNIKAKVFWECLTHFNRVVKEEAEYYSALLGVTMPHTLTTVKPSGTVSKLFGLTEGWHLPSMAYYMRWVQFSIDDPLVEEYRHAGYPTRELVKYPNTVIVGFPTTPVITELGMDDALVLAGDATPEQQYRWLQLGEQHWIKGEGEDRGNQISYTLKYKPELVDFKSFCDMIRKYQRTVRCCSVMPQDDSASYEYTPEEAVNKAEYEAVRHQIKNMMTEDVSREHVDCANGACPVDFKMEKA